MVVLSHDRFFRADVAMPQNGLEAVDPRCTTARLFRLYLRHVGALPAGFHNALRQAVLEKVVVNLGYILVTIVHSKGVAAIKHTERGGLDIVFLTDFHKLPK